MKSFSLAFAVVISMSASLAPWSKTPPKQDSCDLEEVHDDHLSNLIGVLRYEGRYTLREATRAVTIVAEVQKAGEKRKMLFRSAPLRTRVPVARSGKICILIADYDALQARGLTKGKCRVYISMDEGSLSTQSTHDVEKSVFDFNSIVRDGKNFKTSHDNGLPLHWQIAGVLGEPEKAGASESESPQVGESGLFFTLLHE